MSHIDRKCACHYNKPNEKKQGGRFMDIHVGDVLELKKQHPCGSRRWLVLRVGMDFKLRCEGCSHELMLPRCKAEKSVKKWLPAAEVSEQ